MKSLQTFPFSSLLCLFLLILIATLDQIGDVNRARVATSVTPSSTDCRCPDTTKRRKEADQEKPVCEGDQFEQVRLVRTVTANRLADQFDCIHRRLASFDSLLPPATFAVDVVLVVTRLLGYPFFWCCVRQNRSIDRSVSLPFRAE